MKTDGLEQQMIISLELIQQKYQRLDELADSLLARDDSLDALDGPMLEMKSQREEIERLNVDNEPLYSHYRSSRPHASTEVRELTDSIGKLMQKLLMKISKLERTAKTAQEQLVPQIHQGVRLAQMKHAYGKFNH